MALEVVEVDLATEPREAHERVAFRITRLGAILSAGLRIVERAPDLQLFERGVVGRQRAGQLLETTEWNDALLVVLRERETHAAARKARRDGDVVRYRRAVVEEV